MRKFKLLINWNNGDRQVVELDTDISIKVITNLVANIENMGAKTNIVWFGGGVCES